METQLSGLDPWNQWSKTFMLFLDLGLTSIGQLWFKRAPMLNSLFLQMWLTSVIHSGRNKLKSKVPLLFYSSHSMWNSFNIYLVSFKNVYSWCSRHSFLLMSIISLYTCLHAIHCTKKPQHLRIKMCIPTFGSNYCSRNGIDILL